MGLCKCHNVTHLFCFLHLKNVCDKCVVSDHPRCYIQSYLQWLQDSEYVASCPLCKQDLSNETEPVVRLQCFDLFHVECLSKWCESNGNRCPICSVTVIQPVIEGGNGVNEGAVNALALSARRVFENQQWAQQYLKVNYRALLMIVEISGVECSLSSQSATRAFGAEGR